MTDDQSAIATVAALMDGACIAISHVRAGLDPIVDRDIKPPNHPDCWIWQRTARTLALAQQGYVVKSKRVPNMGAI